MTRKKDAPPEPEGPAARWVCLDPADAACGTRLGGVLLAVALSAHAAVVCPCQIESSVVLGQKITSFVHVGHRARTRRAFSRPG
jgi:hypothetical protein